MNHADRARALFEREYFTPAIDHALLAAAESDGEARAEMQALVGILLEKRGMFLAAIRYLDDALAAVPDHARALAHRGAARDRLTRQDQARADLTRAVELDPDYPRAWEALAYVSYDLGDDETFERCIANLERLDEMTGYIYRLRGLRRLEAGDREGAAADLRAGCRGGDPMSAFHLVDGGFELISGADHALWGLDREKRQLPDEAIAAYQTAVDIGFDNERRDVRVTGRLADLLVAAGRRDEALAAVTALTERKPDRADAWLTRGRIAGETSSFARAAELDPAEAPALARHLLASGDAAGALEVCRRRLESDPEDIAALALSGEIDAALDREDEARQAWLAAEALGDTGARRARVAAFGIERGLDHFQAALDLLDRHRKSDAIVEFENAIERFRAETRVRFDEPSRYLAKSLYNVSFLRELQVDDSLIEANFREALEIDPSYTDAMLSLGNLCLRTGRVEEGLDWFARAGELDPSAGQGWFYRARHFAGAGDHAQVIEDATRAFEAYSRRGQGRFAADAVMLRGESNEALGNLMEAKRDYDLAYDYGHPTGYAMGDNIRNRIALEVPDSDEAFEVVSKIIERIEDGEYPWAQTDVLAARTAGSDKASALVDRLRDEEPLDDEETAWLVQFLSS